MIFLNRFSVVAIRRRTGRGFRLSDTSRYRPLRSDGLRYRNFKAVGISDRLKIFTPIKTAIFLNREF